MVFHITTLEQWDHAGAAGRYEADSLRREGYIHCSRREQVTAVANRLFRPRKPERQVGDLVLLCIDVDRLTSPVKDEKSDRSDEVFPHVYGPINLDAVTQVLPLRRDNRGDFELPAALRAM